MDGRVLTLRVLALAGALLFGYAGVLALSGRPAGVAETNLAAGLVRLQALERAQGPTAVLAGTSIAAKLDAERVFANGGAAALNMGIDGGASLYSVQRVAASAVTPSLLAIEANLLTRRADGNAATLDGASDSAWFRLAARVPLLRVENRPSTRLYAWLKGIKDRAAAPEDPDAPAIPTVRPLPDVPARNEDGPIADRDGELEALASEWERTLGEFAARDVPTALVMIPDGGSAGADVERFARTLAARMDIPYLDLRTNSASAGVVYSDGTHLVESSARRVADALNRSLTAIGLLPSTSAHDD